MLRCDPYFPSRCEPATHQSIDAFRDGEMVRLNGRLTDFKNGEGVIADEYGALRFSCGEHTAVPPSIAPGDFVSLVGSCSQGLVSADAISILSPAQRRIAADGNHAESATTAHSIAQLKKRSAILAAVRGFFAVQGFSEVETPALSRASSQETHLESFETVSYGARDGKARDVRYLVTSPEHDMKALLGGGFEKIYQICRCFRNGESTATHNPEFTMVEWYRAFASYEAVSRDVENLVSHVCLEVLGSTTISYRGRIIDLQPPWCVISVREAFQRFAGIDLDSCRSARTLAEARTNGGGDSLATDDSWEEIFFKLFIERVEPRLIDLGPVLLVDFPAPLASLSKLSETEPQVAERVEAYIGGLEVANGFTELNDPRQQRSRFMAQREERKRMNGEVSAIDEQFLHMMARGMPPAAGIAVGLDRLVMLLTDAVRIEDVLAFPFQVSHR